MPINFNAAPQFIQKAKLAARGTVLNGKYLIKDTLKTAKDSFVRSGTKQKIQEGAKGLKQKLAKMLEEFVETSKRMKGFK